MPIEARIREEFAKAVEAALGGLSPNQASYKTGVSSEYIRQMRAGKVPSREVIQRFAEGLGVSPLDLMSAAGYDQSLDLLEQVELHLRPDALFPAGRRAHLPALHHRTQSQPPPPSRHGCITDTTRAITSDVAPVSVVIRMLQPCRGLGGHFAAEGCGEVFEVARVGDRRAVVVVGEEPQFEQDRGH